MLVPFWSLNPIFWLWNHIFWLWSLNFLDGKLYKEWQSDFCIFFGPFFGPEILYFGPRILYFGPGIVFSLMESFIRNDKGICVSFLVPFLYFLVPFWSWNPIFWSRNLIFWTRSLNFLDGKLYKEWQRDFCIFFGPFLVPKWYILVTESYILVPES